MVKHKKKRQNSRADASSALEPRSYGVAVGDAAGEPDAVLPYDAQAASEPEDKALVSCTDAEVQASPDTSSWDELGYCIYAKAALMTILSTFLSLSFIVTVTNIDPDNYQPCNDVATGCLYKKIFAAGNVDATKGYFASVQNGNETIMGFSPDHVWEAERPWRIDAVAHYTQVAVVTLETAFSFENAAYQPPALCPNMTAADMRAYCARSAVKEDVQNHLLGPGRDWFIGLSIFWGVLRIFHDWLVLGDQQEPAARVGFLALFARGSAAVVAAYWALGSTSVFISVHPSEDCACFYQMPPVQALLTLVSPVLLLKGGFEELEDWARGTIYGDYLQFQPHRIAHHIERCSSTWQEGHLMVWRRAVRHQVRMRPLVYARLLQLVQILIMSFEIASLVFLAPLVPASVSRADEVVIAFLGSLQNQKALVSSLMYTILDWVLYLSAWTVLIPFAMFLMRVWTKRSLLKSCFGQYPVACCVLIVCCVLMVFGLVLFLSFVESSIPSGLSQREARIWSAEQRGAGQFLGAWLGALAGILVAVSPYFEVWSVLAGKGVMKQPMLFLKFCEHHPDLLRSFHELELLKAIAETFHDEEDQFQSDDEFEFWRTQLQRKWQKLRQKLLPCLGRGNAFEPTEESEAETRWRSHVERIWFKKDAE